MMRRASRWITLLLVGTASCAYYSQEDGQKLADEVYALQTRVESMQKAIDELQAIEEQQGKQIAVMTRDVGKLSRAARRNDADLGVEVDEIKDLVARLRGRVEAFDERVSGLETTSSKVQEELDLRFQGLEEKRKIDEAKSQKEKQQAIAAARTRERLVANPRKALSEAENLLKKGEAAESRRLVREVLIRHESKRSFRSRRPFAQFLIGETYFVEENYRQAAAEYNNVRKKYSRSKYVPPSLYKLGMCFEKLNLKADAKIFYKILVENFGKTSAAKQAKARLKKL